MGKSDLPGASAPDEGTPAFSPPAVVAKAPPIKLKRPEIYDTLKAHLFEANLDDAKVQHPRVHEHIAVRGFAWVPERDPATGEITMAPSWQERVVLHWWKAHGLHRDARISNDHFEQALYE